MPFTHVTGLGRIFEFIFNLIGANTQENVDTISLYNLVVQSWGKGQQGLVGRELEELKKGSIAGSGYRKS